MILADKIIALRKKAGWSQEELAQQLNVSRQSVSKWEGAQSVPDLERILQMSHLFGVSTDYLLKDELEVPDTALLPDSGDSPLRRVTMEEAAAYLDLSWRNAPWLALGVALCIFSPIVLLMLGGLSGAPGAHLTENAAGGIGIVILLLMVAAAAAIFIACDAKMEPFHFLEKEPFETEYGVAGMVRQRQQDFRRHYTRLNTVGVCLCILAAVPLFMVLAVSPAGQEEYSPWFPASVCALLALVGLGAFALVYGGTRWEAMQCLLEEGDYTRRNKARKQVVEAVSLIYWLVVVAGYLAYSIPTGNWAYSWLVWPVAGILYGAALVLLELAQDAAGKSRRA